MKNISRTCTNKAGGADGRLSGDLGLIADVAGQEAALKIAHALKGATLYIPAMEARDERDAIIRSDYEKGATAKALSVRHGITERAIRLIVKGCRKPGD